VSGIMGRARRQALSLLSTGSIRRRCLSRGPSDVNDLLLFAALPGMQPPLALLVHAVDEPARASFFPFAAFSPEWRALLWALKHDRPVRFVDWPAATALAVRKEREAARAPDPDADEQPPASADPLEALAQLSGHPTARLSGMRLWKAAAAVLTCFRSSRPR
jgi:uncharacterized protein DUF5682